MTELAFTEIYENILKTNSGDRPGPVGPVRAIRRLFVACFNESVVLNAFNNAMTHPNLEISRSTVISLACRHPVHSPMPNPKNKQSMRWSEGVRASDFIPV